jgi:hypothetical protein
MTDLWTEASRDLDAERDALAMSRAKVAAASLWPFLSMARTEGEFEHRLAIAADRIAERVGEDMFEPLVASLREDFRLVVPEPVVPPRLASLASIASTSEEPMEFFHVASGRWVTLAALEGDMAGHPAQPTGGVMEQGPLTGETGGFPQHPTGMDPISPLQQEYPLQPTEWSGAGKPGWNENPMSFAPYRQAATNPGYFSGGAEGAAGDQQDGFPQDDSLDEADDRVDMYGAVPPQRSSGTTGDGHPYSNAGHLGTRADLFSDIDDAADEDDDLLDEDRRSGPGRWEDMHALERERERERMRAYYDADSARAERQRQLRAHRGSFYDPADPDVRAVASMWHTAEDSVGSVPPPPPSMMPGGPGSEAMPPMDDTGTSPSDQAAKMGAQVRDRPDAYDSPSGVADEYDDNNWDAPAQQRPMQAAEHRRVNTPQRPQDRDPIAQNTSSVEETDDEQGRRASLHDLVTRVARQAARTALDPRRMVLAS